MVDSEQKLRERQETLVKIVAAIDQVLKVEGWQTLKELVFDEEVERLERVLLNEAKSDEPSLKALYKLQGELTSIRQFIDLKSYAERLQKELQGIKANQK